MGIYGDPETFFLGSPQMIRHKDDASGESRLIEFNPDMWFRPGLKKKKRGGGVGSDALSRMRAMRRNR